MPTANTARSYTGAHVTSGYDVSGRRSADSNKSTSRTVKRSNRKGGRK